MTIICVPYAFAAALAMTATVVAATGRDNGQIHACTGVQPGSPAVLCVRSGATGAGNGSAAAPFSTLQAAIDAAKAGDVLQVAAGAYPENVRLGAFNNGAARHLTLLGGFDAGFAERDASAHITIIDGGLVDPAVQLHLSSNQTTVLDGFEITRGRGLGTDWQNGYGHGGGIYATLDGDGEIILSHNHVHGNYSNDHTNADTRGGGIHTYSQSWGGATGRIRIEDNLVRDNHAGKGAGIHVTGRHAVLVRNRVQNNIGHHDHGGGIYISTGNTEVIDNVIAGNVIGATQGYGWGGGVLVAGASADLRGNVITDNHAPTTGAGVFWDEGAVGTMSHDLIVRNRCPGGGRSGAAIYVDGGPGGPSQLAIEHITVADHVCPDTPSGAAVVVEDGSSISIRNSILWGNSREFATLSGGSYTIAHSITQTAGPGNFHQDPQFADTVSGDYHVHSTAGRFTPDGWVVDAIDSPAIDAGDRASDFSLEPKPNGGRVNLGAYGNTAQASRSSDGDLIFANGFE